MNRSDWTSGKEKKKVFIPPSKAEQEAYLKSVIDDAKKSGLYDQLQDRIRTEGYDATERAVARGGYIQNPHNDTLGTFGLEVQPNGTISRVSGISTGINPRPLFSERMRKYKETEKLVAMLIIVITLSSILGYWEHVSGWSEPHLWWVIKPSNLIIGFIAFLFTDLARRKL